MYATPYDLFLDLLGLDLPFLKIANTFGFFVAVSFLITSYVMGLELKRKEKEGLVKPTFEMRWFGKSYNAMDYAVSGFFGFLIGFKIIPLLFGLIEVDNPQDFLLSIQGNWIWGIVAAALSIALKFREDKKQRLEISLEKEVTVHPFEHMGTITMIALISGIIGAKLFHNLENWNDFMIDPIGQLTSFSGLTFYGGLIFGAIGVIWYAYKKKIAPLHMLDVGAPTMMLAYCIGRMGCHMSGDGDWGIANTSPKPNWLSWAPDWLWAYDYPNNVNNDGEAIAGCIGDHCSHLVPSVYPTPLYEIMMAGMLFFVLWKLRKKVHIPGVLFGIYMILNGIERFFIEKIRVNTKVWGTEITQAEVISSLFILGGIGMITVLYKMKKAKLLLAKTQSEKEEEE